MKYFLNLIYSFALSCIAFPYSAKAQSPFINNPCVRTLIGLAQDSLIWQASPCANFDSYNIYGARNGGDLIRIGTVSNAAQLHFVNNNNGEVLREYYVAMSCGGAEQFVTLTIDNERPTTPDLRSVSIINNVPVVSWNSSVSTDVIGYYLYKENPYGSNNYFPYPSINFLISGLQYVDNAATDILARYALVAVSPCNKGLLGEGGIDGTTGPHSSIKLTGTLDSCSQHIQLAWNAYQNWREGVSNYEIWVSVNGQSYVLAGVSTQNNYTYQDAQDTDSLVFYIKAIENTQNNNAAVSNTYALSVAANRPMDFIYVTNINVNANNEIELSWQWDTDVDYKQAAIVVDNQSVNNPIPTVTNNIFIDNTHNANNDTYTYQIEHTDLCNLQTFSNTAQNLLLQAKAATNFNNTLQWQPFTLQYASPQTYEIHRQWGNQQRRLAVVVATDLTYTDPIDISDNSQYNCCYHIVANSLLNLPTGRTINISSRSNTVCVYQNAIIHLPNAFVPDGENRFFKPVFVFKNSINDYNMAIFDRYGKIIYETTNYNDAWRGDNYPQGTYTYLIQFKQANGEQVKKIGTVLLIR